MNVELGNYFGGTYTIVMVKLNNGGIKWIVKNVTDRQISTKDAAALHKVSQRMQQLTKNLESGAVPKLNWRKPGTEPTPQQVCPTFGRQLCQS